MKKRLIILSVMALMLSLLIYAQDWPQYLGPERNGTSPQTGLLRTWPAGGPDILWIADVGIGYGGPVVKEGRVFLLDRKGDTEDILRCFDFSNGKELWNYSYDAPGSVMFPGSRSVPTVDGSYVYSCGHNGDLHCIDIRTHKPVWRKNIWTDFGGTDIPNWAITQCPLVYIDMLIVASMAPDAGVVAYNKITGGLIWNTPNLGNETYVSPSIAKVDGRDHIVMITSSTNQFGHPGAPITSGKIIGIEPLSGKILWEYNKWDCKVAVATALDAGNNKILAVGGYELGTVMIEVIKQADGSYSVNELFRHNNFGDQTKPPLFYNGYFYAQFSTNIRREGLVCMNMNGEIMWKTGRAPLFDKGSMILADGLILATDGKKTLYLIEPDPSGFRPLASAELLNEGGTGNDNDQTDSRAGLITQNWAPIALAYGKLLIRDQARLLCVKIAP